MSSIGKSEKFRQNSTFKCLLQPAMEEVFRKDYKFKGKWNSELFENNNPITLELGCGKGEYTIALAQKFKERNFIGIDIKGARLWKGAKFVEENGLKNVKFIRTSIDFIESFFTAEEVEQIWITFADPQIKSDRKRLTNSMFLKRYKHFLNKSGIIHLKTDSIFLHKYTLALATENHFKIHTINTDIYNCSEEDKKLLPQEVLSVQTFYEKFFLQMGLPITYLSFSLTEKECYNEPTWDKEYWKKQEEIGRIKKSIR